LLRILEPLLVFRRELRAIDRDRQLVDLAGEAERHLIVSVVHRRSGIGADVEGLVPLQDKRNRAVHLLGGHLLADRAGLIWNLRDMLSEGYVVVATDYPGLGTDGIHPYLIGESEGRAVLDSVRAARHLARNGTSNRFAVWGHSQGGHAALYTGEIAKRYAPELELVGVAAAAPATYLVELFDDDATTEQDLIAMALLSWARLLNISPGIIVEPTVMEAFNETARGCLTSIAQFETLEDDVKPLERHKFLKSDPTKTDPWKGIMVRNSPGQAPAGAPVFIAQGTADTTVDPQVTKRFAKALCAKGERVTFVELPGVSHIFVARDSAPAAIRWMNERFSGAPAPSDCE
jgi:acetyl esterase/lipase